MDHAKWLDAAAAWAERLSVAAEAVAHAFDIAKQDTPTPDEFADGESDVMKAAALIAVSPALGMIEYQQATARYADLVANAEEEAPKQYHASVSDALTALGYPIVPCPPIASQADIPNIPVPPDVGPQLGPGVKLAEETPFTTIRSQIEKKFDKHAADFGITAPRGSVGFDEFEQALRSQIQDPATLHINGTYRGDAAIINYNPNTGLAVIQKPSGEFVSGWRLSPEQASNVLQRGSLR
jgi:colicin D